MTQGAPCKSSPREQCARHHIGGECAFADAGHGFWHYDIGFIPLYQPWRDSVLKVTRRDEHAPTFACPLLPAHFQRDDIPRLISRYYHASRMAARQRSLAFDESETPARRDIDIGVNTEDRPARSSRYLRRDARGLDGHAVTVPTVSRDSDSLYHSALQNAIQLFAAPSIGTR